MTGVIVHRTGARALRGSVLLAALVVVAGCGRVKQEDFQREMADMRADMRAEMEAGDRAVEDRLGSRIDAVDGRIDQLELALRELQNEFEVTVERLEQAIRFNAPVHFAFDDDAIRTEDRPVLDRFAETVRAYYAMASITVEGFTDSAGSAEYNLRLGQRRAESVKEYLASRGLPSDQLKAVSYGQAQDRQVVPGARGPGEEGWQNRRVAMVIDFNPDRDGPRRVASGSLEEDGQH
jgi:peptidoglycan-associated lipoprotein